MNDFKSTYRKAVSDMENVHIDMETVLDEGRRRRVKKRRNREKCMTFIALGGIFALCTFGSVQAAEYVRTVIKVNEYGFHSADPLTMAREREGSGPAADRDSGRAGGKAGAEGSMEAADEWGEGWEEELQKTREMDKNELKVETMDVETREYASVAEFREKENVLFVLPDMGKLGYEVDSEQVWVNGIFISVGMECGEKSVFFDRVDYSSSMQGHASSTVYAGGVCNERKFTTSRGYEYVLVDSKEKQEDGSPMIHAAISVGYYELYADFYGFGEEEAKQVLEDMDLSAYEP